MEIYDGPYFRINKNLMIYGGLWPYESRLWNIACRIFMAAGILIMTLPQWYGLYLSWGVQTDVAFEDVVHLIFLYAVLLKLLCPLFSGETLKTVYDSIAENWTTLTDPEERRILAKYSQMGIYITKAYIGYSCLTVVMFVSLPPLIPLLLNVIDPLMNETRRPAFVWGGAFPVDDMYDHYIEIYVFDLVGIVIPIYVVSAVDPMYACSIEHCNGLFSIVKHRLKTCTDLADIHDDDVPYRRIVEIVKLHKKILVFAELLEDTYSTFFLFIVFMSLVNVTLTSVIIIIKQNMFELVRYTLVLLGFIMHLFYLSWPGQKLIDHSGGLFEATYINDWYDISQRAKVLLLFMRLRCLKPCQLTAGSIYVMNFQNFGATMRTAASYIAVCSALLFSK